MDSAEVFATLKAIYEPLKSRLHVATDSDSTLYLERKPSAAGAKPEMFGAVMVQKNYVAFHYMPVYSDPTLLADLSGDLRKRLHGKSCFKFTDANDPAIEELRKLVHATADVD